MHYFLVLSKFAASLEAWLTQNPKLQSEVKNYVLSWIKDGLRDWDITRDIPWGVPIPLKEAAGKVLYGWFDNHLAYISMTAKFLGRKGVDGTSFWNDAEVVHFIGKDIVYHHYLFLPAMRLGEGSYKLPDAIPTRGHLLLEGQKFSKSRGRYISLKDFLTEFPADYLRYYLAAITPYRQSDVNFDWTEFQARINNELVATIGNFIHRTLTFIYTRFGGRIPRPRQYDEKDRKFLGKIKSITDEAGTELAANHLDRGLRRIIEFAADGNQYFQNQSPWADSDKASSCLFLCANAVRALSILLHPYLPFSTAELWRQLGLKGSVGKQTWDGASTLGVKPGHRIRKPSILFRKVEDAVILEKKSKLRESPARDEA